MIKGLCKIENTVIAIQLLRLMDERGCKPNVVTYNTIVDSLCKEKMIDDAFKLFKEMVFERNGLCNLADAFCKEGKIEEAENVVEIMIKRGIVPDIVTYSTLIDGYCLQGEMAKAKTIFDSMVFEGVVPDIVPYKSLLNGYWQNLKIDEAMLLFHKMNEKGLRPNAVTYTIMLWASFRVGNYGTARKLFDEMRAKGLKDECMYRVTLEGLCNNNLIEDTLSLFHLMGDSKLNSCINVYNILIDGASNCGKFDIARVLFQDLTNRVQHHSVEDGYQDDDDSLKFFHSQLLQSVTKMRHYSSSLDMFKQMCALRVPVSHYTVNIAIKCCCHLHRTNDGFAVLCFCFRRGISPNVFTFSTLLNGLVGEERILEAETFFKKLVKGKLCEPDVVMYSTMIKGLCKIGNNVIAIQLLRLMDEREMVFEQGISPNVITYSGLIDGLCNLGRWEEASKMLQEMLDVGISPNVHTFSILVDAFCKEGQIEEAENVIDIMLEKGILPDTVTYNTLIDGYCLRGEMTKARTILDSMVLQGVVPDIVTYSSLLNGYWKNSKIDEAMLLSHKMNEKGLKPDAVTYNTMLWGLFRVGNCGAARKLFDDMRAKGLKPDECTYRVILEGLCNNNLIEDALSLFYLMGDSKLNSCINVHTILIAGASKCGKLDIARVLFQDLTNKGLHPNVQTYTVMISGFCKEGYLRNQYYDDIEMLLIEMEGRHYSLDASTLSLLLDQIAVSSLDTALLDLISKLVPKELVIAFST
uniref:Tetratricopeptide-like helical domain-containing protein n=1 Tax=Tanacetum cinerariifolium TaxID=118510 RepID=A0A699GRE1_TANCI|nr:tetratricopeptide-like helical domain-containing protein [Tanacetum cinerariifolium]